MLKRHTFADLEVTKPAGKTASAGQEPQGDREAPKMIDGGTAPPAASGDLCAGAIGRAINQGERK